MGHVDGRLTRDVLAPMFVRALAHVDVLDVADQAQGRSVHARRAEGKSPGLGQRSFSG